MGELLNVNAGAADMCTNMRNIRAIFHSAQAVRRTDSLSLIILKMVLCHVVFFLVKRLLGR